MSNQLRDDSKKYRKDAKNLNLMALYQKYGPIGVVVLLVTFVRKVGEVWMGGTGGLVGED